MSYGAATSTPDTSVQSQSRYPCPRYPRGWFQVAYSDEIDTGAVKPLKYFGKPLVIFRTESGKLSVLDATCPHMRAHLGLGGKVKGESVVCPSHGWQFGTDGVCTGVPYLQKIPPNSSVACWPVREVNGLVMIWHDIDKTPPTWEVPHVPELSSDDWGTAVRREWKISTSSQEAAENLVDTAHFNYLRGTPNIAGSFIAFDDHKIHMKTPTTVMTPAGVVQGEVESRTIGLGFATHRFTGPVETLLIACVSPIDKEYVRLRFSFAFRKVAGADVMSHAAQAFVDEVSRQLDRDEPLWENKVCLEQPFMCDGDEPIGQFRHWAEQFYPDWYKEEARAAYDEARRT